MTIVVNGQPTVVESHEHEPLRGACARAMSKTGHLQYGPVDRWEARNQIGELLDMDLNMWWIQSKLFARSEEVALDTDLIYLNLKPGVAA